MKKLILLLGMLGLCFVPFWKQQWEERWDEMQDEKEIKQFNCGTKDQPEFLVCGTRFENSYRLSANGIDGEALFKANCAACHPLPGKRTKRPMTGILERIPGGNWKYDFIHDSQKLIKSGDAYANAISKEFNGAVMPAFPKLTNEEIDEILRYCNN